MVDRAAVKALAAHVVESVEKARAVEKPFYHLMSGPASTA